MTASSVEGEVLDEEHGSYLRGILGGGALGAGLGVAALAIPGEMFFAIGLNALQWFALERSAGYAWRRGLEDELWRGHVLVSTDAQGNPPASCPIA